MNTLLSFYCFVRFRMDCENIFNFMLLQGQKGHEKDQEKDAYKRNWKCKVEFWFSFHLNSL